MSPKQAQEECADIACHLRNMLSADEREEAGIEGRPLHIQVMRALSFLKDQIGSGSQASEAKPADGTRRSAAPNSDSHSNT